MLTLFYFLLYASQQNKWWIVNSRKNNLNKIWCPCQKWDEWLNDKLWLMTREKKMLRVYLKVETFLMFLVEGSVLNSRIMLNDIGWNVRENYHNDLFKMRFDDEKKKCKKNSTMLIRHFHWIVNRNTVHRPRKIPYSWIVISH